MIGRALERLARQMGSCRLEESFVSRMGQHSYRSSWAATVVVWEQSRKVGLRMSTAVVPKVWQLGLSLCYVREAGSLKQRSEQCISMAAKGGINLLFKFQNVF